MLGVLNGAEVPARFEVAHKRVLVAGHTEAIFHRLGDFA